MFMWMIAYPDLLPPEDRLKDESPTTVHPRR